MRHMVGLTTNDITDGLEALEGRRRRVRGGSHQLRQLWIATLKDPEGEQAAVQVVRGAQDPELLPHPRDVVHLTVSTESSPPLAAC